MVYQVKKKIGNNDFYYVIKNLRFDNKWKKISKYVGTKPVLDVNSFFLKNIDSFTEAELVFKLKSQNSFKNAFNTLILPKIEKKAIWLSNLFLSNQSLKEHVIKEFSKEFIFNSNKIEGSRIPRLVFNDIIEQKKTTYSNRQEIQEVKNSMLAIDFLENKFIFNVNNIKQLYKILTKELVMSSGNKYPSGFKKHNIIVGNATTTEPEKVETELILLLQLLKQNKEIMHPLELAFLFHLKFEAIHPFEDGNGRTGRLLMNKLLMQNNYPPIIIYQTNRNSYFGAIHKGREGLLKNYNTFMLEQTDKSYFEFYDSVLSKLN